MDSTPKRWILKPLSPTLRPSDLQTMTLNCSPCSSSDPSVVAASFHRERSQDILAQTSHVPLLSNGSTEDSDQLYLSSSSSVESLSSPSSPRCGFYSFVEDPMSLEAKQNESWRVSAQRQAYLATLKEETGFRLQAYNSIKKPQTLFSMDKEDLQYRTDPCMKVICETEEKQLRKEIIRSQAPRKIVAQMPRLEVNLSQSTDTGTETHTPVHSRTKPTRPETTEKYQTNFKTIRKLFLNMEQEHLKARLSPDRSTKFREVSALRSNLNASLSRREEEQSTISPKSAATEEDELNQQKRERKSLSRRTTDGLERGHKQRDGSGRSNPDQQDNTTQRSAFFYEGPTEQEIRLPKEENNNSPGEEAEMKMRCSPSFLSPKETQLVGLSHKKEINTQNLEKQEHQLHEIPEQGPSRTNASRTESVESELGSGDSFPSPCCPHRHLEESKFCRTNVAASCHSEGDAEVRNAMCFQKDPDTSFSPAPHRSLFPPLKSTPPCESDCKGPAPVDLIKKEIQEVLKREQELKETREYRKVISRPLLSPASLVEKATMMAVRQFYPQLHKEKRVSLSSSSARPSGHVTSNSSNGPQPCSASSRVQQLPPSLQSLTEIPLQDFEELKSKESSYGGILLIDNINNKDIVSAEQQEFIGNSPLSCGRDYWGRSD